MVAGLVLPLSALVRRDPAGEAAGAHDGDAEAESEPAPPLELEPWQKIATYWANAATIALFAGLAVGLWLWRDRSLGALGLEAPERLAAGLALAALALVLYAVDTARKLAPGRLAGTRERWRRDTPMMPRTAREVRHSLVLVLAAAVGEEIVFRGFLVTYLAGWTGTGAAGLAAAVAAPAAVFAVAHLYQGPREVAKIFLFAGLLGAIFVITGSLWIPIALHLVIDLVGSLLGPWLMRPEPPAPA